MQATSGDTREKKSNFEEQAIKGWRNEWSLIGRSCNEQNGEGNVGCLSEKRQEETRLSSDLGKVENVRATE